MTRTEFLLELDKIVDVPAGTLNGSEQIEDIEGWDSVAMISFIALVDSNNGGRLSPRQIGACVTVDDLLKVAQVNGTGVA